MVRGNCITFTQITTFKKKDFTITKVRITSFIICYFKPMFFSKWKINCSYFYLFWIAYTIHKIIKFLSWGP